MDGQFPLAVTQDAPQIEAGESPRAAARRLDLLVLDEEETVRAAVLQAMDAQPTAVADFVKGKRAAIGRLIGETIRLTGGRASPDQVRRLLEDELARRQ
jgi:aspartyl-tRNA(Asn)/glutamyl-tRNA(Gln) amidotransferase subunit B